MCGICGLASNSPVRAQRILHMAGKVNHRGHEAAGVAVSPSPENSIVRFIGAGAAREAFRLENNKFKVFAERLKKERFPAFVAHTRYSTVGESDVANGQPLTIIHPEWGRIYLVHNGQIAGHQLLRARLEEKGHRFETQSDSETLLALIAHSQQPTLPEAVAEIVATIEGAFSILVLNDQY